MATGLLHSIPRTNLLRGIQRCNSKTKKTHPHPDIDQTRGAHSNVAIQTACVRNHRREVLFTTCMWEPVTAGRMGASVYWSDEQKEDAIDYKHQWDAMWKLKRV